MKPDFLVAGNIRISNNVFLAPMAGYTDHAFRHLALKLGAGFCFTELVSAKGLILGKNPAPELLYCAGDEEKTAAQLFGSDPYYMRAACESEYLKPFKAVDINMGCPVPKVFDNGEGSALLADKKRAEAIIKECVASGKTVTVKIRTGLKRGDDVAAEFARLAEGAGASLVTVHGRVREDYYSGEPDYGAIARAKRAVSIPVIANGGIFTEADADEMLAETGADGVMLARGAIRDPFLICKLTGTAPVMTKEQFFFSHVKGMKDLYGEARATREFRKFVPYYFKGIAGIKDIKEKLVRAESTEEIIKLAQKIFSAGTNSRPPEIQ